MIRLNAKFTFIIDSDKGGKREGKKRGWHIKPSCHVNLKWIMFLSICGWVVLWRQLAETLCVIFASNNIMPPPSETWFSVWLQDRLRAKNRDQHLQLLHLLLAVVGCWCCCQWWWELLIQLMPFLMVVMMWLLYITRWNKQSEQQVVLSVVANKRQYASFCSGQELPLSDCFHLNICFVAWSLINQKDPPWIWGSRRPIICFRRRTHSEIIRKHVKSAGPGALWCEADRARLLTLSYQHLIIPLPWFLPFIN